MGLITIFYFPLCSQTTINDELAPITGEGPVIERLGKSLSRRPGACFACLFLFVLLFCGLSASAQTISQQQVADLQRQVAEARGNADNAWMLISSALVLMMTGPGLALFYGGLVRRKNVLSTMMQSFAMM